MNNKTTDPLHQLIATEQDARMFGFEWPHTQMIIDQAISECAEIKAAIADQESNARIQEEIGDLLHTAISLCMFAGFDVNETLTNVNAKFSSRMNGMKHLSQELGLQSLHGKPIDFTLQLWNQVKQIEKNTV